MDQSQIDTNRRLANEYHVGGYPTLIVLSPDGRYLGQTGYTPGGPQAFDANVQRILQTSGRSLQAGGGNADQPNEKPEAPHAPPKFVPIPPEVPLHYGALTLKGVSGPKDRRIALINNQTLMVGETARVKTQDREVVVHCKEIGDASVLITADDRLMELKLRNQ
jgi:hypothetical protein